MKDWINKHWFNITMIILLLIIPFSWIIAEVIHYNSEPENKVYVEWIVYDGSIPRTYSGTYDMKGTEFSVYKYWQSAGKYSGSYRVVSIVDKDAWGLYISKQSVCIYTGMNDVEVKKIKVLEIK